MDEKLIKPQELRRTADSCVLNNKQKEHINKMLLDKAVQGFYELEVDEASELGITDEMVPGVLHCLKKQGYEVNSKVVTSFANGKPKDHWYGISISWLG